LDLATGLGDQSETPFWAFLIGGFFFYVSYYGTDQSQVQRELSAPTIRDTKRAMVLNGLARFPLTLLYLSLGAAAAAAYANSVELQQAVAASGKVDYLVPHLILQQLPEGVRAVLFAAILSAAMSSLDSSLNSLSAATSCDFVEKFWAPSPRWRLTLGKIITVVWGVIITGFAFLFWAASPADTVIEGINKVGSLFYGPILAAFLTGLLWRRPAAPDVICGLLAGVGANVCVWLIWPDIHWMWWNVFGVVIVVLVTGAVSRLTPDPAPEAYTLSRAGFYRETKRWWGTYLALGIYFFVILLVILLCTSYARHLAG
jgi:SSS family solute:Na+ symporter